MLLQQRVIRRVIRRRLCYRGRPITAKWDVLPITVSYLQLLLSTREEPTNGLIYLVSLIVVVLFICPSSACSDGRRVAGGVIPCKPLSALKLCRSKRRSRSCSGPLCSDTAIKIGTQQNNRVQIEVETGSRAKVGPSYARDYAGNTMGSGTRGCEPELVFEHVRGAERMSPVSRESRRGLTIQNDDL